MKEAEGYKLFLANRSNSTTGYMGVHEHDGRFRASRKVDGKNVHIGMYDTAVEAAVAYAKHAAEAGIYPKSMSGSSSASAAPAGAEGGRGDGGATSGGRARRARGGGASPCPFC